MCVRAEPVQNEFISRSAGEDLSGPRNELSATAANHSSEQRRCPKASTFHSLDCFRALGGR
jgi:hypothetical protein